MSSPDRLVWLALPHVGSISPWVLDGCLQAHAASGTRLIIKHFGFSIATHTFNQLWCDAYNARRELGITHFAMMHADIQPEPGWLDTLLAELERTGADVVSAVVAIKDCKGLTSTGLRDPQAGRTRRLTMREVHQLPPTFSRWDTDESNKVLAINTGLWVCRFDGDWPRRFPGFSIANRLDYQVDTDTLTPHVDPEDWRFAEWLDGEGLDVRATRAVKVWHTGLFQYPNDVAWGEWETDREYFGLL